MNDADSSVGYRRRHANVARIALVLLVPLLVAVAMSPFVVAGPNPIPPPRPAEQGVTGSGSTPVVRPYGPVNGSNPTIPPRAPGSPSSIPSAPQSDRSYYITTLLPAPSGGPQDPGGKGYGLGQQQGQTDQIRSADAGYPIDSAVILAFGKPHVAVGGIFNCPNPNGFATLLKFGTPACRDDIKLYVENWIEGYIAGLQGNTGPHLTLAIGVNNTDNNGDNNPDPNAPLQYDHVAAGQDWGNLVNELTNYARYTRGNQQVIVFGGDDIETGPSIGNTIGFEPPNLTKLWLQGYQQTSGFALYDFGDSGGCPANDHSGSALCNGAWYQRDVWAVSMTNSSYPVPEIYANPSSANNNPDPTISINASVWEQIALYDYAQRSSSYSIIPFLGSLTQYTQCVKAGCPTGTNNKATDGWTYLYKALNDTNAVFLSNNRQQASQMAQTPEFALDIADDIYPTVPS